MRAVGSRRPDRRFRPIPSKSDLIRPKKYSRYRPDCPVPSPWPTARPADDFHDMIISVPLCLRGVCSLPGQYRPCPSTVQPLSHSWTRPPPASQLQSPSVTFSNLQSLSFFPVTSNHQPKTSVLSPKTEHQPLNALTLQRFNALNASTL
jgi:hypothetical protein